MLPQKKNDKTAKNNKQTRQNRICQTNKNINAFLFAVAYGDDVPICT